MTDGISIILITICLGLIACLLVEERRHRKVVKNYNNVYNQHVGYIDQLRIIINRQRIEFEQRQDGESSLARALDNVIVKKGKILIQELDAAFKTIKPEIKVVDRMHIKNVLLQMKWLESGDVEVTTKRAREIIGKSHSNEL